MLRLVEAFLFVTRKTHGIGGMQQYNADLWTYCQDEYPEAHKVSLPSLRGICGLFACVVLRPSCTVHLGDASLSILLPLLNIVRPRWHVIVSACGLDIIYPRSWYQWMICKTLSRADHIVCISHATAQEVMKRGIPSALISIIPPILPQVIFSTSKQGLCLITIGRLITRKGVLWFLKSVLPRLVEMYPDLQYHVVGDGPDRGIIEEEVRRSHLSKNVYLHGTVSREKRTQLLQQSSLFVAPNIRVPGDMEGFGIVCIEASSCGVPVIAAHLEGVQDAVIDGNTGLFFESGNAEECIRSISRALHLSWDRHCVARTTTQRFGWEALRNDYRSLWGKGTRYNERPRWLRRKQSAS